MLNRHSDKSKDMFTIWRNIKPSWQGLKNSLNRWETEPEAKLVTNAAKLEVKLTKQQQRL